MNAIEVEVRPRSPFQLTRLTGGDRLFRATTRGFERLLIVDGAPVIARICRLPAGIYRFSASAVMPESVTGPGCEELRDAGEADLAKAVDQVRFSVGIDLDLRPIRDQFEKDPLLGPALTVPTPGRPSRRPQPWEALLWAITEQLIEYKRAAGIQRRMIRKWGLSLSDGTSRATWHAGVTSLATVPSPEAVAGAAPAELEGCGLSARRSIAMIRVAREVASGRVFPDDAHTDRRLLVIPEIGPWTVACLGLRGRGDPDALLAGDLSQMKLVGYIERLGRLAEVDEVEAFYQKYAPWRGLAGEYLLAARGKTLHGSGNTVRIRSRAQRFPRAA